MTVGRVAVHQHQSEPFPTGLKVIRDRYGRLPTSDDLDKHILLAHEHACAAERLLQTQTNNAVRRERIQQTIRQWRLLSELLLTAAAEVPATPTRHR